MFVHHIRRGSGPPLLLVHGVGDSNQMWSRVLGRLARQHECFAIDVPGFGRSAPLEGPPSVEALASACAGFMRERGHATFHVAGNSMGGAIALELARSGAARSATALSPSGFVEGWEAPYKRATLLATRAFARAIAPLAGPLTRSTLGRRILTGQMNRRGHNYRPHELRATLAGVAAAPSFTEMVGELATYRFPDGVAFDCPVTVAWGSHDFLLLTRPQSARARDRLPGARHVVLHNCGHIPTWDDPEQVARVILETAG
jgi:pimeloyl-ACP methyl ester carboxylesterase